MHSPSPTEIRWLTSRDLPQVLEIENDSFPLAPWDDEIFRLYLRQRSCIGVVAETHNRIKGYMVYELKEDRFTILHMAVAVPARRLQVGTQMVQRLKGQLSQQRRRRITLVVSEMNIPGQLFFRAMGFRATRVYRDYFPTIPCDAYEMSYSLRPQEDSIRNRISAHLPSDRRPAS